VFRRIDLRGLNGGHSGVDIHLGRGNANKLLVRFLRKAGLEGKVRLAGFAGGTARNAIPRESRAVIACEPEFAAQLGGALAAFQRLINAELANRESGITVSAAPAASAPVLMPADQSLLFLALNAAPFGVKRMSGDFAGVVETSNNLGIVILEEGEFSANLTVRSLRDSGTTQLAEEIDSLFRLAECRVTISGHYPSWPPNLGSKLLVRCQQVYSNTFGGQAATQVIHAGLECGIIGAKYPGMDIVSFGPTICGAHAPGERVEIVTVAHCWTLLKAILAAL
jgi:dipeptidase D